MIVSFCVVAYNEQDYLPRLFKDICSQTYPHSLIEVIFVNGMSTDHTRGLMENFKEDNNDFKDIIIVDNPKRNQASGWNIAIKVSTGNLITRIDAHASIPADFVQKNVDCIKKGECISGGPRPCILVQETPWNSTLLLAENSMFGSGFAPYRRNSGKTYVKSMFHATYKREVFEKVGYFNENLGRTEDNEIHYRMRKAGYRFCFNSDIISYQYVRSNLFKMIKQKSANGYWIGLTVGVCPRCLSLFHFIPLAFILGIVLTTFFAICGSLIPAMMMWIVYCLMAIFMTVLTVRNDNRSFTHYILPIVYFLLHLSYGLGTLVGIIKLPFWMKKLDE
ncbi:MULTISPECIES: glycosyltransferase family 2 protein [Bacillus]|uniref:glycosyltransferase family 2 protein n=1 Tax=Bacillus TaxID=1386 RepID=UPI0002D57C7A|nr:MULTISPECIES: glycosyltransferase family 2 protein [Bacillus]